MTMWIEYQPDTGRITSQWNVSGYTPEPAEGGIVVQADGLFDIINSRYDAEIGEVVPHKWPDETLIYRIVSHIVSDLTRTDYTQSLDAPDHMSTSEIDSWRTYRSTLRSAMKKTSVDDMLLELPVAPDGTDFYASFRTQTDTGG